MRLAREAIAKKDVHQAETWLTKLVEKLPDEPLAAEAAPILAEYYRKNHEAKDDELERKHAKKLESSLKVAKRHYDGMLKKIEQGLTTTRSTSISRRHLEAAFKDGERALDDLDRTEKKLGRGDPDLAELLDGYRDLVKEHMVSSQLHLASSYSVQTSYQQAHKAVNRALSVSPNDQKALAARARIGNAAARGGVLRWW